MKPVPPLRDVAFRSDDIAVETMAPHVDRGFGQLRHSHFADPGGLDQGFIPPVVAPGRGGLTSHPISVPDPGDPGATPRP